jgi:colanic acid biosynthesis glycosyl transferase WcaI
MNPVNAFHLPVSSAPASRRDPYHILIVTPYYWPILSSSTHLMKDLAEGLADGGCRVTVLSNRPATMSALPPDDPRLEGRIIRARNPFLRRLGTLAKFSEYLWFMIFFVTRGLAVRKVDIIFVVSTPPLAGLPGALLARLKGAKLVYNLQDIFPDSAVVAGMMSSGGRAYRWLRKAEEATYRASDLVASISPSFSERIQRAVPDKAVATIPNWVNTDHIRPRKGSEDPAIAEFRQGGTFVVQYAGNIGYVQNLDMVLGAARHLKHDPGIRFVFIGDGNAKEALEAQAREQGLDNCVFLPLQPLDRVPSVYNACDVGVIPLKPGAAEIAVPSKTWNYLAAGRPVICCVEEGSSLAQVVHESRSGTVVPPTDSAQLAQIIRDYRDAPDRIQTEGRQGRDYVETRLSRGIAIQSYLKMFDRLFGAGVEGI